MSDRSFDKFACMAFVSVIKHVNATSIEGKDEEQKIAADESAGLEGSVPVDGELPLIGRGCFIWTGLSFLTFIPFENKYCQSDFWMLYKLPKNHDARTLKKFSTLTIEEKTLFSPHHYLKYGNAHYFACERTNTDLRKGLVLRHHQINHRFIDLVVARAWRIAHMLADNNFDSWHGDLLDSLQVSNYSSSGVTVRLGNISTPLLSWHREFSLEK